MRFVLLLLLFCLASSTQAIDVIVGEKNGRQIIVLQGGIEKGDTGKVAGALRRYRHYDEIWLNSPGGSLAEGIGIGLELRAVGLPVRVPNRYMCISACTVAFLGGVLRTVEENGRYEVHAYSGSLLGDGNERLEQSLESIMQNPGQQLVKQAYTEYDAAAFWGPWLFLYFQRMIQPGPRPERIADLRRSYGFQRLNQYLEQALQEDFQAYGQQQASIDARRVAQEGKAAAHEIVMRLERDAMRHAIAKLELRNRNEGLGRRGDAALRMLKTMFESRIKGTSALNRETLREFGYINLPPGF